MGHWSWTAKTDRASMSWQQWVRLLVCLVAAAGSFTLLLGEWQWETQLVPAAVVAIAAWITIEIVWLIHKDNRIIRP
jgi:hypothetical protein